MSQNTTGKLPFKTINLEEKADFILSPPQDTVSSRFGHSLTTLDLNLDGFLDLVVSAPSFGLQNITYQVINHQISSKNQNWIICSTHKQLIFNRGWFLSILATAAVCSLSSRPYASRVRRSSSAIWAGY
jgi:hypothetical protein